MKWKTELKPLVKIYINLTLDFISSQEYNILNLHFQNRVDTCYIRKIAHFDLAFKRSSFQVQKMATVCFLCISQYLERYKKQNRKLCWNEGRLVMC